jgi:hypothetical protein
MEPWLIPDRRRTLLKNALDTARPVNDEWRDLPVGELLCLLREELSLHQDALGRRIGMRQSMISRIERGSDLRVSTLRSQAMGCELVILPWTQRSWDGLSAQNRIIELERRKAGAAAMKSFLGDTTTDCPGKVS